ncbi:glycosyltransferase [Microbulbifer sp. ANSA002]|uniref:glycosyltransferase n=1 Tax=unclassified Microbulbifer TaxID=2619833 RepID=UPI00404147AD
MSINIHTIIPPNDSVSEELSLYQRCSGDVRYQSNPSFWRLSEFSTLSFDTYFNVFNYGKWKKYCSLNSLSLKITASGSFKCNVMFASRKRGVITLNQTEIDFKDKSSFTISIDLGNALGSGLIYVELKTNKSIAKVYNLAFSTKSKPKRNASLALIMPTYKREKFVEKNINTIKELKKSLSSEVTIDLVVIDNGKTLSNLENSSAKVIFNKNYGGSGGFARGLIEVLSSKSTYSHIILCDDDIVIEPSIFTRLQSFYSHCISDQIAVSGSMLRLDNKTIQHENGATLNKDAHFIPIKSKINLNNLSALLENDQEVTKAYAGWWFFSASTEVFKELGLPIPVFLKWDDVEFSLRATKRKVKIIDLNGIGVWHEPFENKYSSSTFFYEERNSFIARSIHDADFNYFSMCRRLIKTVLVLSLGYRYDSAQKVIDGTKAALRGYLHLHDTLPDELHSQLISSQKDVAKTITTPKVPKHKLDDTIVMPHLKILSKLTLNGHLLPKFCLRPEESSEHEKIRILEIYDLDYTKCFRSRYVQYTQPSLTSGFIAQRNTARFFGILIQLTVTCITSYKKFPEAKKSYLDNFNKMTSIIFWKKFLKLK